MMRYFSPILISTAVLCPALHAKTEQPNVVLIVCDDLNDYITGIPGDTGHLQSITPNVERLAKSGVAFRRAYSNNPVCAPSRASFLTGIYPHTSKNLFWDKWFTNPVLNNSKTIMEYFRDNGYHTAGTGKLMHHFKRNVWQEFAHQADYGPFVHDGEKTIAHPSVPQPFNSIGAVDGSFASLADIPFADDGNPMSGWVYNENWVSKPMRYVSEDDRDPTPDERNAQWAADRIARFASEDDGKPFFLAVGFIRPHTPLHVPQKYFDLFPLESVEQPVIKPGDAADCHYADVFDENVKGLKYFRLLEQSYPAKGEGIRAFTQAYLASVAAVDDCIGQVVAAIDNSPLKDNTIIVLVSDHGWNMGEKDYLFKNSLWEESTRIPFVVRAPGVAVPGGVAEHPVSLIDLYPTLVDLCGLEGDTRKNENGAPLDGFSVRPFLENPQHGTWDGPEGALTMIYAGENALHGLSPEDAKNPARQHWSVRTQRWRYIRYNNGMEELYDHDNDPHEWINLAGNPEFEKTKTELYQQILKQTGLAAPNQPVDYQLVWADEFNTDGRPDPANWTYEQGFVRNQEEQWYQPDNATCVAGLLVIEGRREGVDNPGYDSDSNHWKKSRRSARYTSSSLTTEGLHSWMYGRFEIRARIETDSGLWPAFWTLGIDGDWPENGEIDIMEYYKGKLHANFFWGSKQRWVPSKNAVHKSLDSFADRDWDKKFHIWRMDWDEERIRLFVDDELQNEINLDDTFNSAGSLVENPFRQPHYILVNLALGGAGGDLSKTAFPTRYEIDYIRVYQKK